MTMALCPRTARDGSPVKRFTPSTTGCVCRPGPPLPFARRAGQHCGGASGELLESAALLDSAAGVNCYLSSRRLTTLKLRLILGTFHKRETRPNYETGN